MVQVNSAHSSSHASHGGGLHSASSSTYHVHKGDTLSGIAARHGVTLHALSRANPTIASHHFIFPGDKLTIPAHSHFGSHPIAHHHRSHHRPTTSQVPTVTAPTVGPVSGARLPGGTLRLSAADVLNLKKTLQTEWVQSAGPRQAQGIIDTILNRRASGHWGNSVSSVVNARNQFSDVNGPVSRRQHGRNSVEQIPSSMVSRRVNDLVNSYLAQRAAGAPSSVGTNLNYANPHFSDARNLGWIMRLDGPIYGSGNAIHRHGTTPDLQRYRPDAFNVTLQ